MKKIKITKLILILAIVIGCTLLCVNKTNAETAQTGTTGTTGTTENDKDSQKTDGLTDFSNAKFNWTFVERNYYLTISGVDINSSHTYFYCVTNSKDTQPDSKDAKLLGSKNNSLTFYDNGYITINKDMYLWIYETIGSEKELALKGQKIEKPKLYENGDVFKSNATLTSVETVNKCSSILFNYPVSTNKRKFKLKIGKITDNAVLKKLKENNDYTVLMDYAKKCTTLVYDKDEETKEYPNSSDWETSEVIMNTNTLQDGAYYFVYVDFDNENGKYIDMEAVTYGKMKIPQNEWFLFLNGEDGFSWDNLDNQEAPKQEEQPNNEDNTKAKTVIPQTGESAIVIATIIGVAGVGIFTIKKLNSMRDIK